ncbi:MAG: hypothetical protein JJT89_01550 [Nitriliruptoraceae bacterium]|nr:hypothetical protein [Nitriliruptoraceae bacterium]
MVWPIVAMAARKVAIPVSIEVARQLDRQLRPHVLAYRLARDVDGYVGRWTSDDGPHYVVFPARDGHPLKAFPPLPDGEVAILDAQLDRTALTHHADLAEAKIKRSGTAVADAARRVTPRRRSR